MKAVLVARLALAAVVLAASTAQAGGPLNLCNSAALA